MTTIDVNEIIYKGNWASIYNADSYGSITVPIRITTDSDYVTKAIISIDDSNRVVPIRISAEKYNNMISRKTTYIELDIHIDNTIVKCTITQPKIIANFIGVFRTETDVGDIELRPTDETKIDYGSSWCVIS